MESKFVLFLSLELDDFVLKLIYFYFSFIRAEHFYEYKRSILCKNIFYIFGCVISRSLAFFGASGVGNA